MVNTLDVRVLSRPEAKVRWLVVSDDGTLAWVEGQRQVFVASLTEENALHLLSSFEHEHAVSYLGFFGHQIVVGDDLEGFAVYSTEGEVVEAVSVDGGVVNGLRHTDVLCFLSGMGHLVLWGPQGHLRDLSESLALEEVLMMTSQGSRLYLVTQGGGVLAVENETVAWRRPARGKHGERITAIGLTKGGAVFLSREGHALVAGDEEALEFEFWKGDELVVRSDLSGRILTSSPCTDGAVVGFDDGSVVRLSEDGTMEHIMDTHHPVMACLVADGHTIASSWFYIHGKKGDQTWTIEHQGMPSLMGFHPSSNGLIFAGDDQNDYTAPEPIGHALLEGPFSDVDKAELNLWFQSHDSGTERSAEAIYGNAEDVLQHLTEAEKDGFHAAPELADDLEVLLDAMGGAPPPNEVDEHRDDSGQANEEALMEHLRGEGELAMEDSEDLFEALNETLASVHRPQAAAGQDQQHIASDDGSAIVHLDGRETADPHGMVVGWAWYNDRGEELAAGAQLKLRLPVGRHRFELRVVDREGAWTTDSVTVEVLEASTS